MKRVLIGRLVAALLPMMAAISVSASNGTKIGDLYYYLHNGSMTATVTYDKLDGIPYVSPGNYLGLRDVVIPEKVEYAGKEYSVTCIGDQAFAGSSITSIRIPATVTNIGGWGMMTHAVKDSREWPNSPFYNCSSLKTVYFEDGGDIDIDVTAFWDWAWGWYGQGEFTREDYWKDYKWNTILFRPLFEGCKVESLYLGRTLKPYTYLVYDGVRNEEPYTRLNTVYPNLFCEVTVSGTYRDDSRNTDNMMVSDYKYGKDEYLKTLVIGPSVSSLPRNFASYCTSLSSLYVDEGNLKYLHSINWANIDRFTIPSTLDSIAISGKNRVEIAPHIKYASVGGCNEVEIADSDEPISFVYSGIKNLYLGRTPVHVNQPAPGIYGLGLGSRMESLVLGDKVKSIPPRAFSGESALTSVEWGENLEEIPERAFENTGLSQLPDWKNVRTIGKDALSGTLLEELAFNGKVREVASQGTLGLLGKIHVGDSVEILGSFDKCERLKSVYLGDGLKDVGNFTSTNLLENIRIGKSIKRLPEEFLRKERYIVGYSMNVCLPMLVIPGSVDTIGTGNASANNNPFTERYISNIRFEDSSVSLRTGSRAGGGTIFYSNSIAHLKSVYLGRELWGDLDSMADEPTESSRYSLFEGLKGLNRVVIGERVSRMPKRIFDNCGNLNELVTLSPNIEDFPFDPGTSVSLYVPKESGAHYATLASGKSWIGDINEIQIYKMASAVGDSFNLFDVLPQGMVASVSEIESTNFQVVENSPELSSGYLRIIDEGQTELLIRNSSGKITGMVVIKGERPEKGDANANGLITVSDAVQAANHAIGSNPERFCFWAADMNDDGNVSVSDAVGIVDAVFDQPFYSQERLNRLRGLHPEDSRENMLIDIFTDEYSGTAYLDFYLHPEFGFCAFQADVRLPKTVSISEMEPESSCSGFSISNKEIEPNVYRVVMLSPVCNTFESSGPYTLRLKLSSLPSEHVSVENIMASDVRGEDHSLTAIYKSGSVAVENAKIRTPEIYLDSSKGEISIINAKERRVTVHSMTGAIVSDKVMTSDFEILKPGVGMFVVKAGEKVVKLTIKE